MDSPRCTWTQPIEEEDNIFPISKSYFNRTSSRTQDTNQSCPGDIAVDKLRKKNEKKSTTQFHSAAAFRNGVPDLNAENVKILLKRRLVARPFENSFER